MEEFVISYFHFKICLKLYHFGTSQGFHHLAADELDNKLNDTFDKLLEAYQGGRNERFTLDKEATMNIFTPTSESIFNLAKNLLLKLENLRGKLQNGEKDLINLIDDNENAIKKFMYLLSFN